MDDFGSSSGGFSSSDGAGFSTDAGGCSAFTSSDTGGISSSYGGFSDSGPFSIDTVSNIGMTSNCDSGLGVSDHVHCDFTGDNTYYHACLHNTIESENVNTYPNQIQMDSFLSTDPIPVALCVQYLTTPTDGAVDGYLNMGGHVDSWEKNIPGNKTEDKEFMLLRSKIAQLQIILSSSKADEHKKAAIRAQIDDLRARMERQGNGRRRDIFAITNCQKTRHCGTRVNQPTAFDLHPTHAGVDIKHIQKTMKTSSIICFLFVIVTLIAFALGMGLGMTQEQRK